MTQDNEITLAMILQHMQGMEHRLRTEFRTEIGTLRIELKTDISSLSNKVDRHYTLLSGQIDAIDKRLDDVEIVQIPNIWKAIQTR